MNNIAFNNIAFSNIVFSNIAFNNIAFSNIVFSNTAFNNIAFSNIAFIIINYRVSSANFTNYISGIGTLLYGLNSTGEIQTHFGIIHSIKCPSLLY